MLNIKDPEAHALAKELAERRNTSMTRAVVDALRRDLDRLGAEREALIADHREEMMAFLRDFWERHPPDGRSATEIDDEMYDENGLPR